MVCSPLQRSPPVHLPFQWLGTNSGTDPNRGLLCGGKFYVLSKDGYILGLDLVAMSLFCICLPDELLQDGREAIEYDDLKNVCVSREEGWKFYLIHIKGFKVFVWLHDAERGSNASNGKGVGITPAEFAYLSILDTTDDCSRTDYLLDVKSRAVEKVFQEDSHTASLLYPFTMVWPPAFPALNEEDDHGHVEL
uniref:F-box protein AT5G49610-like beta-propeller domain-containing protein n=1 Tax=Setaria viridis TaxID=4556 RepID=A0A4U6TQV7_SETVI|nr:hypothetical protein SEVIR_7G065300v2 [Setaria viridis]